MAIITLLLRHGASHFRVPLQHQLHSIGMLPTMVAQLSLDIRFSGAIASGMGIGITNVLTLEPVIAHISLLKD